MASNRPKRAALTVLPALTLVVFLSAFVVALGQNGAAGQASSVTVDVGALPVGAVKTVTLTIHALGDARWPVFVVADRPGHVVALIGRPQSASGCALTPPGEAGHVPMLLPRYSWDAFEDGCSGAMYGIDGRCVNGPCHHWLDRLPATRHGDRVTIGIDTLVPGRPGKLHG